MGHAHLDVFKYGWQWRFEIRLYGEVIESGFFPTWNEALSYGLSRLW